MKKILLSVTTVFLSIIIFGQTTQFEWAKKIGGPEADEGRSIKVDIYGNVYTTGRFDGIVDFDPGPGKYLLNAGTNADIFVSKLDAKGNFIWAISIGGSGYSESNAIVLDDMGSPYITGHFGETTDFDPDSIGSFYLTPGGYADVFVAKYDSSGKFVWANSIESVGSNSGYSIALDLSNNVFISGESGWSMFIAKYNSLGKFEWKKAMLGHQNPPNVPYSLAIDKEGNIFSTGVFTGRVDFDPDSDTFYLTSAGGKDIFITKFNNNGNFVWAKRIGGTRDDYGTAIALNISGDVFVTGAFSYHPDFDPGSGVFHLDSNALNDIFVLKLTNNGNFVWAKNFGSNSIDKGIAICVDASSNLYIGGTFSKLVNFDPKSKVINVPAIANGSAFILKLDSIGDFKWVHGMTMKSINSITTDAADNVYTTGTFTEEVDFDPGVGTFKIYMDGYIDVFILKLRQTAVGIEKFDLIKELKVYPNPTPGHLTVDLQQSGTVTIYDMVGNLLYEKPCTTGQNNLDISALANGIYLLKVNGVGVRLVKVG